MTRVPFPRPVRPLAALLLAVSLSACASDGLKNTYPQKVAVGEQLVQSGEFDKGYRVLDNVARTNEGSAAAQLKLADSYYRQGAYLKAETHYRRLVELGKPVAGHVGLGRVALKENDPEAALAAFRAAHELDPAAATALNGIGVAHDLMGDHVNAQANYEAVLEAHPTHAGALSNMALSLALSGRPSDAKRIYARLVPSYRDNEVMRHNLALTRALEGDETDAVAITGGDLEEAALESNLASLRRLRGR